MAILGNQTIGFTFSISGSFNQSEGGIWTTPSPNGIIIDSISCYAAANGSASNARLYVWRNSDNVWIARSDLFSLGTTIQWVTRTSITANNGVTGYPGLFIPPGVGIWIGIYVASANYNWQAAGSGTTRIGTGGDGNYVNHGTASGPGVLAAYVTYHPCYHFIRRAGVWVCQPKHIERASVFTTPPRFRRRSTTWKQVQ